MKQEMPTLAGEKVWNMEQREEEKSIWRALEQFLPVGDSAKLDEIKSLYGVSRPSLMDREKDHFIYMTCCSKRKYTCKYIVRWGKTDGMVQAKGEHNHHKFSLPRPYYEPNKCRKCPFKTVESVTMRQHYGQFHPEMILHHCALCSAHYSRPTGLRRHVKSVHGKGNPQEKKLSIGRKFDGEGDVEGDADDGLDALLQPIPTQTGIVQIANCEPVEFELSQNCSTVAEQASFLLEKINERKGEQFGLDLESPVKLSAIFNGKTAVLNHEVKLNRASKYSFRFKLAVVGVEAETGPNPTQELATHMAPQQSKEMNEARKKPMGEEEGQNSAKLVNKPADKDKMIKREWPVDLDQQQQCEKFNSRKTLKRRVEGGQEAEQNMAKNKKMQEDEEQKMAAIAEYATLIGVPPTVDKLNVNYNQEKLINLIGLGNGISKSLYIQANQQLRDKGLLQSIADLLAGTEKPEKMIGEVKIESLSTWPQNEALKLKRKQLNMPIMINVGSASPGIIPNCCSAEYELVNKDSHFQVLIYYCDEESFGKSVWKFIYRRLA